MTRIMCSSSVTSTAAGWKSRSKSWGALGISADLPGGSFYLWVEAPEGDAWGLARTLAQRCGVIVSPGEFYGPDSSGYVRIAVVQPTAGLELALSRAGDA